MFSTTLSIVSHAYDKINIHSMRYLNMKRISKLFVVLSLFCMVLIGCNNQDSGPDYSNDKRYEIYQLAVEDGYTGTYEQWLESIKGKDGHTPVIEIGDDGYWYIDGVNTGVKAQGQKGDQGEQGNQGNQGDPGKNGKDGTSVLTGNGAPNADLGKIGDSYIDLDTWNYYVKEEKGWVLKGNIKGESGGSSSNNIQGLQFYLTDDNEYYVAKGTSTLLSDIVIPEYYNGLPVTGIMERGFENSKIKSIKIPDTVKAIGKYAFDNCYDLVSVSNGNGLITISDGAFTGCSSLTTINLPNSVTSIGGGAFTFCSSLTSISIPNSVISIEGGTFLSCSSLTSVTIGNGVTSIGKQAFCNCTSLASIIIPEGVTSIGEQAFQKCSSLTSVIIPNGVTSIGERAFYQCSSLTFITIGNSVASIGREAFYQCSSLTSINIPDSVTSIGERAFYQCSSLTSINIPDSVTSIGERAFYQCSSLKSVIIGNGVTSIGQGTFSGCTSLESITLPFVGGSATENQFLGFIFGAADNSNNQNCVPISLKTVIISDACTSIATGAFSNCSSLTSIIIGNNVASIGITAFWGCISLTSIIIPNSVTSIGHHAFSACPSLTIYCQTNSQPSGWDSNWNSDNRPVVWGYNE